MKKASANMWWIIIGAVIALVVLIILLVIFTDRTTSLESGLLSCEGKGGQCVGKDECNDRHKGTVAKAFDCTNPEAECCFGCKEFCDS
tara:strand:- start:254 stop:517 length:264 start_codon:yes stop_codon:yes gene_type:complete